VIEKELSYKIVGGFYAVYNDFGYGFLENVYANALALELETRDLKVQREVPVEICYLGKPVGLYRIDMLVNGRVLVEVKSCAAIGEANNRQLFNYLRASRLQVALLLSLRAKARLQTLRVDRPAVPF
jgi:GxxExxY protein